MTKADFPLQSDARNVRAVRRLPWILVVLIVSVLLHLIAIEWLTGAISMPMPKQSGDAIVTATLTAPAVIPVTPVAEPAPPKPKLKAKPRAKPMTAPATESVAAESTVPEPSSALAVPSDDPNKTPPEDKVAADDSTSPPAGVTQPNAVSYKINLPPSAELKYDVQKTSQEGQPMYGHGAISWQTDGTHYTVDGEAGVLFFTVLNFKSVGNIDGNGVAPEIYSEKRFRRAETATHFHRERNTISFSSSTKSYPRNGGEQDRASVIWQLAGIGRGDREKFVSGAQIDLMVAGTRDAETWSMVVVGEEEISIAGQTTQAWHVTRIPRPGSHDQKLDIWLAPQQNWYPVRLRYTETNGDYLDMSLTSLSAVTPLSDP